MIHYAGASIGSFLTGWLGQVLHSRKKSLNIALATVLIFSIAYFFCFNVTSTVFYAVIFFLGVGQGYWGVFVTVASEHFGTNIRSTVTTTAPNFVRGATYLMTTSWLAMTPSLGVGYAAIIVGAVVMTLAIVSTNVMEETFGKDLDYHEE